LRRLSRRFLLKIQGINWTRTGGGQIAEVDDAIPHSDGKLESLVTGLSGFPGFGEKTVLFAMKDMEVMSRDGYTCYAVSGISPELPEALPECER